MSGFEIAGVVLGSLPVLFNSALVVQKGLQNTIDWIRFNRKFEDFVTRVEIEEISYRQVLKLLLDKTPIPQHEFNVLISNSRSDLWKDAYIIKAIESRFDEAEKAFVRRQLASLSYAVQGLQDLLPSNLDENTQMHEKMLSRIKFSFGSKADGLLKRVNETNNALHDFLKRDINIQTRSVTRERMVSLKGHQEQAKCLHEVLVECWNCSCFPTHEVGITRAPTAGARREQHQQNPLQILLRDNEQKAVLSIEGVRTRREVGSDYGTSVPAIVSGSSSVNKEARQEGAQRNSKSARLRTRFSSRLKEKASQFGGASGTSSPGVPDASTPSPSNERQMSSKGKEPMRGQALLPMSGQSSTESAPAKSCGPRVIDNVCGFMADLSEPIDGIEEHGEILFGTERKVSMRLDDAEQRMVCGTTTRTLTSIVNEHHLTSFKRLEAGMQLTATVLSIASTPWLPKRLNKEDMTVLLHGDGNAYSRLIGPYFSHSSTTEPPAQQSWWNAKSSLLSLGVILLELFHGVQIENQHTWSAALRGDGSVSEATTFVSAFAWLRESKVAFEDHYGRDYGVDLYEALRKCIRFDFGYVEDPSAGDLNLAEKVFREVVWPLQDCCPQQLAM